MQVIKANSSDFDQLVQQDVVLVDFSATWCGPCRMLEPVLDELASERSSVKIVKVDIDESTDIAKRYGVMSVPSLFLFQNGRIVSSRIGFAPKEELIDWINQNQE